MAASADDVAMFGGAEDGDPKQPASIGGTATADDIALFGGDGGQEAPPPKGEPPQHGHGFADFFRRAGSAAYQGLGVAGTLFTNAADAATAGGYSAARNWVESKIAPEATAQNIAREQAFNEEHPLVANSARAIGYLAPGGVASTIAKGVDAGVSAAANAAPSFAQRFLAAAPVRGAITGGLTSGLQSAAEASASGAPLAETARQAGKSALVGAGVGAAFGTAGAALDKGAQAILESKGGKARELLDRATPEQRAALADVPKNDRGIAMAAKKASRQILDALKEDHARETLKPYRVIQEAIDKSPAARQTRDISPLIAHMQDAAYDLETAPHVRSQLESELKLLDRYRDDQGRVMVPERQLNGLRRSLMRAAKVGGSAAPSEADAPLRSAAFMAKQMVDEGPYGALNDLYATGAKKLSQRRVDLGLKERPSKDAEMDARKLRLTLQRQTQNTGTGGGEDELLKAFRERNPGLAPLTELPNLAKARADLAFHLTPQHGGLMGRAGGEAMAGPLAAYGLMTHPTATAGALAAQNVAPLAGRLGVPIAREVQLATRIRQYIARGLPAATAVQLARQETGVPAPPAEPAPMSPEDLQL